MNFRSDTSGLDRLLARVHKAQAELPRVTKEAAQRIGDTVKGQLSSAAPRGPIHSLYTKSPPGDTPGLLSESFSAKAEQRGAGARMTLSTNQPNKFKYVTQGRGVVLPVRAKALWWPGLAHPVKRAGPSKANPFADKVMAKRADAVKTEMQKAIQELKDMMNA